MARRQSADPLERYDTPAWITRALVEYGSLSANERVLEPMAGAGAMVHVLNERVRAVHAFDIEPRRNDIAQADAFGPDGLDAYSADWSVVTNPPFSRAAELWRAGCSFRRLAMLVRITWLERCADREDVDDPKRVLVLPRPKFVGKGSDSATVVWACWGEWAPGIVRLTRSDKARLERKAAA